MYNQTVDDLLYSLSDLPDRRTDCRDNLSLLNALVLLDVAQKCHLTAEKKNKSNGYLLVFSYVPYTSHTIRNDSPLNQTNKQITPFRPQSDSSSAAHCGDAGQEGGEGHQGLREGGAATLHHRYQQDTEQQVCHRCGGAQESLCGHRERLQSLRGEGKYS